jgi:hypothetical protein
MKKQGWPDFPFSHWQMKPTLENIACHLHTQNSRPYPSGFTGEATSVERQIIEHLGNMQRQVRWRLKEPAVTARAMEVSRKYRPRSKSRRTKKWRKGRPISAAHIEQGSTIKKDGVIATYGSGQRTNYYDQTSDEIRPGEVQRNATSTAPSYAAPRNQDGKT